MPNVWRLMAFQRDNRRQKMFRWAIDSNRIAVGWSEVGDLFQPQYATPEDIQAQVNAIFGGQGPPAKVPTAGIQLWNFRGGAHPAMQCGDLVLLKADRKSVVMRVTGPYEYVARGNATRPPFGYQHQREAEVTDIDPNALWEAARPILPGQNRYNALVRCHEVGQRVVNGLARNRHHGQKVT